MFTSVNLLFLKALLPIVFTLLPIVNLLIWLSSKALSPIISTLLGMFTSVNLLFLKALLPIVFTLLPIVKLLIWLLLKASSQIISTLLGMFTSVNLLYLKAWIPIVFTLSPIFSWCISFIKKALSPIISTGVLSMNLGITTSIVKKELDFVIFLFSFMKTKFFWFSSILFFSFSSIFSISNVSNNNSYFLKYSFITGSFSFCLKWKSSNMFFNSSICFVWDRYDSNTFKSRKLFLINALYK